MNIYLFSDDNGKSAIKDYLAQCPSYHEEKIKEKLEACLQSGLQHPFPNLKLLKPKIWHYQGKIYKLRVDTKGVSSRVFFIRDEDKAVVIHAFCKRTRTTPKRDGKLAIRLHDLYYSGAGQLDKFE